METHFEKGLEIHPPPLNSLDSSETLSGSPPNSLEKTLSALDFDDNLSPSSEETLPDNDPPSDFDSLLEDNESKDGEIEENELINPLPLYNFSSHWAESWSDFLDTRHTLNPWSLGEMEDSKAASEHSGWIDWNSCIDFEIQPNNSAWLTEPLPSVMGAGLANLGNTCFLNAILQCFTHTVPLLQGLLSCNHKVPCDSYVEGFCVFCNLYEHVHCSLVSTGKIIYPWKFVNNLKYFSSSFQRYQQEDAHEFLQCFLDKLEGCCGDFKLKDIVHSDIDNIVKRVFGGRLISMLKCCNCGHCSDTFEPSIDLSLEIEEASNLHTALKSFTKVEKIEDETKITCENCKEQVSVEKQLRLDQVPSVAAFHLKRFKNDGSFVEKIDKFVAFPLELDLQPFTGGSQNYEEELKYDLYAVVVHTGFSSTSGHYYCFIRAAPDEWYKFDDSKVAWVPQEYVLLQEAYILFYAKQGTPCFSNFIHIQKQWMDVNLLNTSPKSVLDIVDVCKASPNLPINYHSDVYEASDVAEEACIETLGGTRDCRVDDSENKENLMSPVPLVASNSSRVDEADKSTSLFVFDSYSDVPSCEHDKSTSLSVPDSASDVPSCEANKSALSMHTSYDNVPSCEADRSTSFEADRSMSVLKENEDVTSFEADGSTSMPVLKENNSNQEQGELKNVTGVMPAMFPRSASPEIYREDSPDTTFSILRGHLRSMDQVSCKRQLNKDLENLERKQAYTLIKKSLPGSRGQQLMAAMRGSLSEGSLSKKRSRGMHTSSSSDDRTSVGRRRSSISVASILR